LYFTSQESVIFWSDRIGLNNRKFSMPKFRSMKSNTPVVATHLLTKNVNYTYFGLFLRKSSLDELPQIWCILMGEMSFVGPRPALYNQYDLIKLRTDNGVHSLLPGLTGLAQINGRSELNNIDKEIIVESTSNNTYTGESSTLYIMQSQGLELYGIMHGLKEYMQ
jgi:O-antigen biosynthesis protein WbqP